MEGNSRNNGGSGTSDARGGRHLFSWQNVASQPIKDRECYLGQAVMVGMQGRHGKFAKNEWWQKGGGEEVDGSAGQAELDRIRARERELMNKQLGGKKDKMYNASREDGAGNYHHSHRRVEYQANSVTAPDAHDEDEDDERHGGGVAAASSQDGTNKPAKEETPPQHNQSRHSYYHQSDMRYRSNNRRDDGGFDTCRDDRYPSRRSHHYGRASDDGYDSAEERYKRAEREARFNSKRDDYNGAGRRNARESSPVDLPHRSNMVAADLDNCDLRDLNEPPNIPQDYERRKPTNDRRYEEDDGRRNDEPSGSYKGGRSAGGFDDDRYNGRSRSYDHNSSQNGHSYHRSHHYSHYDNGAPRGHNGGSSDRYGGAPRYPSRYHNYRYQQHAPPPPPSSMSHGGSRYSESNAVYAPGSGSRYSSNNYRPRYEGGGSGGGYYQRRYDNYRTNYRHRSPNAGYYRRAVSPVPRDEDDLPPKDEASHKRSPPRSPPNAEDDKGHVRYESRYKGSRGGPYER